MSKRRVFWGILLASAVLFTAVWLLTEAGFSWSCHCDDLRANNGCGSGCTFVGVTCGPGEIQWCGTGGPCRKLETTGPCYDLCKHLLTTGGTCVCGNYVWPLAQPVTTTTAVYTTTTSLFCGGADLQTDENNCGFCGNVCPTGYYCSSGLCRNNYVTTTSLFCGGADLNTDENNCGFCGNVCPTGYYCSGGFCMRNYVTTTSVSCSGADLETDENNCGFCGNVCPDGYSCNGGFCYIAPQPGCTPATLFSDDFTGGLPGGWKFNESGGDVEFSDSGQYLMLTPAGYVTQMPQAGRADIFSGIGTEYFVEMRFQYPAVGARSSGVFLGTYQQFNEDIRMPAGVGAADRENILSVSNDRTSGLLVVKAFGRLAYSGASDTSWHVVRLEHVNGLYRAYLDGSMYASGFSTSKPASIWFGNYSYYSDSPAEWSSLRVDYVRVGTLCEDSCSGDFSSDPLNCGFCGNVCPAGYQCGNGLCLKSGSSAATTTTSVDLDCQTPQQYGAREICCDNADNDNDGLVDAEDPYCSADVSFPYWFNTGISNICYGSRHSYRTSLSIQSGYFSCSTNTTKMRFYLKASSEQSDKLTVYDGNKGNSMLAVLPANFNGGQYGWTEYYPTNRVKFSFNSDPAATNYGFDIAKIDCFNDTRVDNFSCSSSYCTALSGRYCNGPSLETRSYFCEGNLCKYDVTGSAQQSSMCGVYGMTIETDKSSYKPGEEVKVRGELRNDACPGRPAADQFVEVKTSFGRWTTYTDYSGAYYLSMYNLPAGSHEITARAFTAPAGDVQAYASRWITEEANDFKVTVQASPMVVLAGQKTTISGRVSYQGQPVSYATVEVRFPWTTNYLTTNGFGEFTAEGWTTNWYGSSNVTAFAQKDGVTGWASAILTVNPAGSGREEFTLEAPEVVKPNSIFHAGGRWFVDGVPQSEPVIVSFRDTKKTGFPSGGIYNVTLLSPAAEGCYLVYARNLSVQTCVRSHDSIDMTIDYVPGTLTFRGSYEDGTPVTGSLAYAIDSSRYAYQRMLDGVFSTSWTFAPGTHSVWANLNDGFLYASATRTLAVGGTATTTTAGDQEETTTTAAPGPISVDALGSIEVYRWETKDYAVRLHNSDAVSREALVRFGSRQSTARMEAGGDAEVRFSVEGVKSATVTLEVISLGNTVARKNVRVVVKEFTITWPRTYFEKGDVRIAYLVNGISAGAVVNDSLEDVNGTLLARSGSVADLPSNGTISARLGIGTYSACANATNAAGKLLVSDCQEIAVKEGMPLAPWFIGALGIAALLLLLF